MRSAAAAAALLSGASASCLCIFDIDRTLTGRQSETSQCPKNAVQAGVPDYAYAGGTLTLSELAQDMKSTFCSGCYLGIISAGSGSPGSGNDERSVLVERLKAGSPYASMLGDWSPPGCSPTSPLVTSCADGQKQTAVPGILSWYQQRGISIAPGDVHMFDDRISNIDGFRGTAYNARQISCAARDGSIGLCGSTVGEVVGTKGIYACGAAPTPAPGACTGSGSDPWFRWDGPWFGPVHVGCCSGLNEVLSDWDGTGDYYYQCQAATVV